MKLSIWGRASVFSFWVFVVVFVYAYVFYGRITPYILQEVFAVAAVIVIAPSLALSGIAYFWNFADRYIIYRKSLGLIGYYFGLVHVLISLVRNHFDFSALSFNTPHGWSLWAGYFAVLLFGCMPLISNVWAIRRLGGTVVRKGLRYLGYAAYVLVLVHAGLLFSDAWVAWAASLEPLFPPPTLLATVIGAGVLLLRVALWLHTVGHPTPPSSGRERVLPR